MEQSLSSSTPVTVIGIGGKIATGTSSLAKLMGEYFTWPWHSGGNTLREIWKSSGMEGRMELTQFAKSTPGLDEQIDRENREFVLKNRGGCFLEARLVVPALRDLDCAQTVLLVCDDNVRFDREAERVKCSIDEAAKRVIRRDAEDKERYQNLYGIQDFADPKLYNHVIDTTKHDLSASRSLILRIMGCEPVPTASV